MKMRSCIVVSALLLFAIPGFTGCRKAPQASSESTSQSEANEQSVSDQEKAAPTPPKANRTAQVIVLGYHRFVNKVRRPDTEITPEAFEEQMKELQDNGITVIPMADLLAWKRGEKEIPEKAAVITLDDGWRSQRDVAWPILQKYGYPFTMFIYTDYVKGEPKAGGESISWDQLAEMRDAGVDIQSHTISHADLRGKKGAAATPEYHEWLWKELHDSKAMLEQKLGIKITSIAVPYGFYNQNILDTAKKAGYEAVFTVNGSKIAFGNPSITFGRYLIEANKPHVFASAIKLGGGSGNSPAEAPVTSIATSEIAPQPADGSAAKDRRPLIQANLKSFGSIDPASLRMRLSGIGVVAAQYASDSKNVTFQPRADLPPGDYTVIVTANSGKKKHEAKWRFTVGPKEAAQPEAVAEPSPSE